MWRMSQNSQLLKLILCRPLAHTEVKVNKIWKAQIATCSHASVQHGWHCAVCYKTRSEQQMLVDM
jgi:hypothetical protein